MKYIITVAAVFGLVLTACNSETKTTVTNKDTVVLAPAAPSGSGSSSGDTASYQRMQQKTTESPQ